MVAIATVALAGVAYAGTTIDSGDVGIVGAASATPATMVRGGSSPFSLSLTADDGNISPTQCDGTKNAAATGNDYTVSSTGLSVGGTAETVTFPCQNFAGGGSPSTQTFNLDLIAGSTAPLGSHDYSVSFGLAGSDVVLGTQLNLASDFTAPRVYVTVNPRPASAFGATAGVQKVDLAWTASPDSSDITDYQIEVTGGKTATLTAANTATSLSDTGLTAGTEYCYRIRARYNDGTDDFFSSWDPSSGTVCATPTAPAATLAGRFGQPIDQPTAGTYVVNKGKIGRVIPVKLEIFDGATEVQNGDVPVIRTSPIPCSSTTWSDDIETYAAGSSNGGLQFRWDASGDQWIYNLDTTKLPGATANKCYRVDADVNSTSVGYFLIQLTK